MGPSKKCKTLLYKEKSMENLMKRMIKSTKILRDKQKMKY